LQANLKELLDEFRGNTISRFATRWRVDGGLNRLDSIKALEAMGCEFIRHGGKLDWYRNPTTGMSQPVPRHREINERLAKKIVQALQNPAKS
jgi:mRNA interferase HicA